MELRLSQNLLLNNRFTISVPGETEEYYGTCDEYGNTEHIHLQSCYHALTEKAQEFWRGDFAIASDGLIMGKLIYKKGEGGIK